MIELPDDDDDDVAAALAVAAAAQGTTVAGLIAEMVTETAPDALDALIGVGASGRKNRFDIHAERAAASASHTADTI